jgi:iron complex outermembrane recepter protein
MHKVRRLKNSRLVCLSALMLSSAPVLAQSRAEPQEEIELDEIVVTANKRSERLQDVPLSVSVVGAQQLQAKGATDYRDYLTSVPGVSVSDFGTNKSNVIIRGLSTAPDADGAGGTSVTYFDEIALGGGLGAIEIFPIDIERIEVLRGPQGTLYGAGSLSGALRQIPKNPKLNEWSGEINGTISGVNKARDPEYGVDGVINIPIGQNIAVRAAAFYAKDPDFIRNRLNNSYFGGARRDGVQLSALAQVSDATKIVLRYVYNENRINGSTLSNVVFPDSTYDEFTISKFEKSSTGNTHLGSATITHDFGGAILTSATGYIAVKQDSVDDFSVIYSQTDPDTGLYLRDPTTGELIPSDPAAVLSRVGSKGTSFSQEIRLASSGDVRFDWLVGGYFQSSNSKGKTAIDYLTFDEFDFINTESSSKGRQYAAFGEVGFKFTEAWKLKAGLRYAKYKESSTSSVPDTSADAFTPKATLEYKPDRNQLYYAQVAKGFRLGGANARPGVDSCLGPFPESFKSDKIWTYEAGAKISLPRGYGTFNTSVFYSDWSNIPIFQQIADVGCQLFQYFDNLGKATSKGFESELVLRPVDALTVRLSASYAKTTLKDGGDKFAPGQSLPATPAWNIAADADYAFPISKDLQGSIGAGVHLVSGYNFYLNEDFESGNNELVLPLRTFDRQPKIGGFATLDLRAGINSERFGINLFANNILNSRGVTAINIFSATGIPEQAVTRQRTIGVTAHVGF